MEFKDLDSVLENFAKEHTLNLATSYQDSEVRSFEIVAAAGNRYQIWIEIEGPDVAVHAWNFKDKKWKKKMSKSDLSDGLQAAFNVISNWM